MLLTDKATFARWQNPITSILSLVAGLILAIGHHFFYNSLDDKLVADQSHFIRQWAISIGTGFAFLAHSALSVSIGITFWQLFWSTLHKKSLKLSAIDSMANSWGSLFELLNLKVIKASPMLVFLALTATVIIPVAVVFPPGTLRVKIDARDIVHHDKTILAPAWERPEAFGIYSAQDGHYLGPSRNLIRSSAATAYQMDLPILPKIEGVPNATYEFQLYAPTVKCESTSSDILANFTSIFNCSDHNTCGNEENIYAYLAWAPLCNGTTCAANTHADVIFNGSMPRYVRNIGTPGYGPAQMYISTLHGHPATDWLDLSNWRTLNCSLYNASHVAKFYFNNDDSFAHFDASRTKILHPVTLGPSDQIAANNPIERSYLSLMDTLGGMLAGTVLWKHEFQEWLVRDTVIIDSKLSQSRQVSFWSDLSDNKTEWAIEEEPDHHGDGEHHTSGRDLAGMIEELFHNMTLSLFAHSDFTAPATVDTVHSDLSATHFAYSPRNLILAYGVALLVTTFIAVLGYISVVKEGKSYSNRLSTVIRTMQGDELNAAIDDQHRGGEDPLPKHLAKTRVQISRHRRDSFVVVDVPPAGAGGQTGLVATASREDGVERDQEKGVVSFVTEVK